jgi:hypothetical protein
MEGPVPSETGPLCCGTGYGWVMEGTARKPTLTAPFK